VIQSRTTVRVFTPDCTSLSTIVHANGTTIVHANGTTCQHARYSVPLLTYRSHSFNRSQAATTEVDVDVHRSVRIQVAAAFIIRAAKFAKCFEQVASIHTTADMPVASIVRANHPHNSNPSSDAPTASAARSPVRLRLRTEDLHAVMTCTGAPGLRGDAYSVEAAVQLVDGDVSVASKQTVTAAVDNATRAVVRVVGATSVLCTPRRDQLALLDRVDVDMNINVAAAHATQFNDGQCLGFSVPAC
jgi:hypothetical protein